MPQGRLLRQDDETGEETRVSARRKLSEEMFKGLTGESGPLPAGALPSIKASSEQGKIAMFQALDDDGKDAARVSKPKKAKTPKPPGEAEQLEPKTIAESGPQETVLGILVLLFVRQPGWGRIPHPDWTDSFNLYQGTANGRSTSFIKPDWRNFVFTNT